MELKGTFLDKIIYAYDPQIQCSIDDLKNLLSKYKRIEILRKISEISVKLFNKDNIIVISGIPITNDILIEAAWYTIKYSNDNISYVIIDSDLLLLFKMCHKLYDEALVEKTINSEEILMNIGYRQFVFQEKLFNLFARNYYIYKYLWQEIEEASSIDIISDINSILGLPYETALMFAYASVGNINGYIFQYNKETIDELGKSTGLQITETDHHNFLVWASGSYDYYINYDGLLNPFVFCPIVETKTKPTPDLDEAYIIINHHLLHGKITSGLYFSLIDKYNAGGDDNLFKSIYGHVFQTYIGNFLKYNFKTWSVIPEIEYIKGKKVKQDSIDWFLCKENKLIAIEVKQSSIFLKSKINASLENIKYDLNKTLMKAAKQLKRTRDDILSRNYKELSIFHHIEHFEHVIVINDPLYNANLIGKNIIKIEYPEIDFDFHIININDFEVIISNQRETESFFDLLSYKTKEYSEMDFNEFILKMFPDGNKGIPFLDRYYFDFFNKIGVKNKWMIKPNIRVSLE